VMIGSLYGRESAYNLFPTSATLRDITRDDVVAMKEQYLRPQNTMLVVAGDVSVAEARAALAKAFGGWQRGGTTISFTPAASTPAPTTIYLKDSPGLNQALIVGSQLVPGRDNADAAAIDALASLLGDFSVSTGSRVYNAFRLERGLSYSPKVELGTRPAGEMVPLYATAAVAPGMADTAINVLVRVMRDLKQDKPALASELDFSKRNLIGRMPSDLQRVDRTAALIVGQMQDRLPPDYLNQWVGRINNLTLSTVQAAAAKYLDPDHLSIVVVADRAKVETALRATGIPVVIVDK
jgi:zinc protease